LGALLTSTLVVAIAEIGDKTQLLSLLLAARFRRPWPIVLGILVATLANHALAALAGEWVRAALGPDILRWVLGASFIAIALWALKPDRLDDAAVRDPGRFGVFAVALVAFFLAEIGDKTQVATVVLAAQHEALAQVVFGTTLGMMIANVPVVLFGQAAASKVPLGLVRKVAAGLFAVLGAAVLLGLGG